MEIELGPVSWLKEGGEPSIVVPSVVVNWGFAHRLELVLEGRHLVRLGGGRDEPRFRLDETALSMKGVLREGTLQGEGGVSVATEAGVLLPTLHGEAGMGTQVAVIVSHRWTDLTLHLDGALAWTRTQRLGLFAGAILEGHDTWAVRPVAELFVEGEGAAPTMLSGLAGAIWRVADDLSFDAAVRLAHAGSDETVEVRAGLTWSFGVGAP